MVNNEILSFVKEQMAQGKSKDEIRDMLVTHGGWDNKDVDEAFDNISLAGKSMPGVLTAMEKKEITPAPAMEPVTASNPAPAPAPMQPMASVTPTPSFAHPFPSEPKTPEPINLTPDAKTGVAAFSSPTQTPAPAERPLQQTPTQQSMTMRPPAPEAPSPEILAAIPGMEPVAPPQPQKVDLLSEIRTKFASPAPAQAPQPVQAPTPAMRSVNVGVTPPVAVAPAMQQMMPPVQPRVMQPRPQPAPAVPQPTAMRTNVRPPMPSPQQSVPPLQRPAAAPAIGMQYQQATTVMKQKPRGRKALGFVMFLIGLILGAVVMHAYLNGYLVSITSMIGL